MPRAFWILLLVSVCLAAGARVLAGEADDQYSSAAGHYAAGHWEQAVDGFNALLKDHADFAKAEKARFFLGEALVQLGRYDDAHREFARYLTQWPTGPYGKQALFRSGETALMAGQTQAAAKSLSDFRQQYPSDPLGAYVLMYLGELALDKNDGAGAEALLKRAVEQFPDAAPSEEIQFNLARSLRMQDKTVEAQKGFRRLSTSKNAALAEQAQLQLALTQLEAKQWDDAASSCEVFEGRFGQSRSLADCKLAHARALEQLGKQDQARSLLETVSSDDHRGVEAAYSLGMTYAAAKNWPAAAKAFSQALDQATAASNGPQAAQIRYQLADVQYRAGQYDEVIKTLSTDQTTAASPDQKYLLGLAYQASGKHELALEALSGCGERAAGSGEAPTVPDIHLAQATSLMALERWGEASESLQKAIAAKPPAEQADRAIGQLTLCQARAGKLADAKQTYQQFKALQNIAKPSADFQSITRRLAELAGHKEKDHAVDSAWAAELYSTLAGDGNPPDAIACGLAGLGWLQLDAGKNAEAAATFDRLLQKYSDQPQAADAAWARGVLCEQAKQYDAALAAYHIVFDRFAKSSRSEEALLASARLHAQLRQYPQACELLERLARERPDWSRLDEVRYAWAWALHDGGQLAAADQQFQRLHDDYRQSPLWADATYRLAESAQRAKKPADAQKLLDELVAAKPAADVMQHALYLSGQIAAAEQHWDRVGTAMQQLATDFPDCSLALPAQYWVAEAAYRQGHFDEAGERLALLSKQIAGHKDDWLAMIPLRQAQVLAQQKKWTEALDVAGRIETDYPGFAEQYEADYLAGRALASQADFDGARKKYAKVLRSPTGGKTETAAMAQWMVGETYFHQEDYEAAIREYLRVEILFAYPRWQAAALLQAGKCQEALRRPKQAAEMYAKLIKAYGNSEFTDEASQRLHAIEQQSTAGKSRSVR